MKKYFLKSNTTWVGTEIKDDISEWFTEEMYKKLNAGDPAITEELLQQVVEQQGLEWDVQEVEE